MKTTTTLTVLSHPTNHVVELGSDEYCPFTLPICQLIGQTPGDLDRRDSMELFPAGTKVLLTLETELGEAKTESPIAGAWVKSVAESREKQLDEAFADKFTSFILEGTNEEGALNVADKMLQIAGIIGYSLSDFINPRDEGHVLHTLGALIDTFVDGASERGAQVDAAGIIQCALATASMRNHVSKGAAERAAIKHMAQHLLSTLTPDGLKQAMSELRKDGIDVVILQERPSADAPAEPAASV